MSQEALTAKYRPQTFEQVAGQEAIKAILSRAAAKDQIAPAYLFSGTRGVGKTTIARIFAKAINCETAPAPEPCNACRFCDQITKGSAVDVMEIDGASNTGVDNVRKLQENVAYAPLDCRYKVIIIDEAHMLSKQAFNALLKTLEEPPGHVVFIMATTEPEKFPQTIISRCQHYVFKRLTQRGLAAHLTWLLEQESISFEPAAVNLLARRGAGSVRDAMSLLSQVLALGTAGLALKDVREVLGLADQELYLDLLRALAAQDLLGINRVLNAILDNGLDLIFFLRELVLCWRNLFLLTQLGEQAKELIDLPEEEIVAWQGCVPLFSLPHIHACWQMTLEGQRKVQTSLDPGLDLEMLLLNLAYLPSLLPLGKVTTSSAPAGNPPHPVRSTPAVSAAQPAAAPKQERRPAPAPRPVASMDERFVGDPGVQGSGKTPSVPVSSPSSQVECLSVQEPPAASLQPSAPKALSDTTPRDWPGFVDYCLSRQQQTGQSFIFLKQAKATLEGNQIRIACTTDFLYQKFSGREADRVLKELSREFFGSQAEIILEPPQANAYTTATEVKQQALNDPLVKDVMDTFGAQIVDVQPRREPSQS